MPSQANVAEPVVSRRLAELDRKLLAVPSTAERHGRTLSASSADRAHSAAAAAVTTTSAPAAGSDGLLEAPVPALVRHGSAHNVLQQLRTNLATLKDARNTRSHSDADAASSASGAGYTDANVDGAVAVAVADATVVDGLAGSRRGTRPLEMQLASMRALSFSDPDLHSLRYHVGSSRPESPELPDGSPWLRTRLLERRQSQELEMASPRTRRRLLQAVSDAAAADSAAATATANALASDTATDKPAAPQAALGRRQRAQTVTGATTSAVRGRSPLPHTVVDRTTSGSPLPRTADGCLDSGRASPAVVATTPSAPQSEPLLPQPQGSLGTQLPHNQGTVSGGASEQPNDKPAVEATAQITALDSEAALSTRDAASLHAAVLPVAATDVAFEDGAQLVQDAPATLTAAPLAVTALLSDPLAPAVDEKPAEAEQENVDLPQAGSAPVVRVSDEVDEWVAEQAEADRPEGEVATLAADQGQQQQEDTQAAAPEERVSPVSVSVEQSASLEQNTVLSMPAGRDGDVASSPRLAVLSRAHSQQLPSGRGSALSGNGAVSVSLSEVSDASVVDLLAGYTLENGNGGERGDNRCDSPLTFSGRVEPVAVPSPLRGPDALLNSSSTDVNGNVNGGPALTELGVEGNNDGGEPCATLVREG